MIITLPIHQNCPKKNSAAVVKQSHPVLLRGQQMRIPTAKVTNKDDTVKFIKNYYHVLDV